ncbi:TauD/TfdA family dioxygenase [Actinacidiphila acididurans]|uniref:TauD/TfdA family dioxygenase n=1 Tax=Actinacidiphila acididurans TaxID=2784346 RepID=A0ABS2U531_9ACTN|nr:TauD/TfdA family dioxygenase [Actinacidiphila acididurans]MBM9510733.1 TauD/TfdA family dioxygenase [Actinacidiphila acididurans]
MDGTETTATFAAEDLPAGGHPDLVAVRDEDAATIRRLAAELAVGHPAQLTAEPDRRFDDAAFLTAVESSARRMSHRLLERLVGFRLAGSSSGGLVLRGLPLDPALPPTPADGSYRGPVSDLFVSSVTQLMVMSVLGGVVAYADEKDGRLIQDVCPVPGAETRQENTGSTLLELHTEDGFHPSKPDFMSLYCLRGDPRDEARTVVGAVARVLPGLSERCRAALREPQFRIRLSSSFTGGGPARWSAPLPVLSGAAVDPEVCLDLHAMAGLTAEGDEALRELAALMTRSLLAVALRPGDLLIVDNRQAVHGRTAFRPGYDGADRWLRRCYAITDLWRSRGTRFPGSRVHRPL